MEKRTLSMLNLEDAQAVVDAARERARANPRSKHEILAEIIAEIPKIEKSLAESQRIIPHLDLDNPDHQKVFALTELQFEVQREFLKTAQQVLTDEFKQMTINDKLWLLSVLQIHGLGAM